MAIIAECGFLGQGKMLKPPQCGARGAGGEQPSRYGSAVGPLTLTESDSILRRGVESVCLAQVTSPIKAKYFRYYFPSRGLDELMPFVVVASQRVSVRQIRAWLVTRNIRVSVGALCRRLKAFPCRCRCLGVICDSNQIGKDLVRHAHNNPWLGGAR